MVFIALKRAYRHRFEVTASYSRTVHGSGRRTNLPQKVQLVGVEGLAVAEFS